MKKLITICVMAGLMFTFGAPAANAAISYGTPADTSLGGTNATPSPLFGTLVDFDDQATGTQVLSNDYVSAGVASITELTGAGTLFARYSGSQSSPNYIGTGGTWEIWGQSAGGAYGWDGSIQIDLILPASMVGIGIANSLGGSELVSVYDSGGLLLEQYIVAAGANVYPIITRGAYDISRLVITGDHLAIDDLQFNAIPAPGAILLGSIGVGLVGWLRRRRIV